MLAFEAILVERVFFWP